MYDIGLYDFLEDAMLHGKRVQFTLLDGSSFTAIPSNSDIIPYGDGDDEFWGCFLWDAEDYPYCTVFYKDIASVLRLDDPMKVVYAPKAA